MTLNKINLKDFSWRCLLAFIFLVPLYFNNMKFFGNMTMRVSHEQMFQLGVTALFVIVFLENLWLATFILWSMFIYIYYNFPSIGGEYIMNLFMAAVLYQVTYKLVTRERVKQIFMAVIAITVLSLIMTLSQHLFAYDPLFAQDGLMNHDPVGLMGQKAMNGMLSAICLPIALFFSPWLAVVTLPALILSQCSSAVAATAVSILFLAWQRSRQIFFYLLVPIMVMGSIYVIHDSKMNMMTNRTAMWKLAVQDALTRPFVGMGLDSFRNVGQLKPYLYFNDSTNNQALRMTYIGGDKPWVKPAGYNMKYKENGEALINPWDNPHNEFVSILYEFGVIGFLIFCALLWDMCHRLYRDPIVITLFAVFLVYLVSSVGQFPFHLARLAHLSIIFLACYNKLTEEGEVKCLLSR